MTRFVPQKLQGVVSAAGAHAEDVGRIDRILAERAEIENRLQARRRAIFRAVIDRHIAITRATVSDRLLPCYCARTRGDVFIVEEGDIVVRVIMGFKELLSGGFDIDLIVAAKSLRYC